VSGQDPGLCGRSGQHLQQAGSLGLRSFFKQTIPALEQAAKLVAQQCQLPDVLLESRQL
jgi:hypothetical protein